MSIFEESEHVLPVYDVVKFELLPFLIGNQCLTDSDIFVLERIPRVPYSDERHTYLDETCTVPHNYGVLRNRMIYRNGILRFYENDEISVERVWCPNIFQDDLHVDNLEWWIPFCDQCLIRVKEIDDKKHTRTITLRGIYDYHSINDEPAIIDIPNQKRVWYENGFKHRSGGKPAVEQFGTAEYYSRGHLICTYNPSDDIKLVMHDYHSPFTIVLPNGQLMIVSVDEKRKLITRLVNQFDHYPPLLNQDTSYVTTSNSWDKDHYEDEEEEFNTSQQNSDDSDSYFE
jgi:hypothetical protein